MSGSNPKRPALTTDTAAIVLALILVLLVRFNLIPIVQW